jgi:thiol-disulfide isomerase/thioredoxin
MKKFIPVIYILFLFCSIHSQTNTKQQVKTLSGLNSELSGNWYEKETGNWKLSFFETVAVYKMQVWGYDEFNLKDGQGSLKLKNNTQRIQLFLRKNKPGIWLFGESPDSLNLYCNDSAKQVEKITAPKSLYVLPVFKTDSAVYSGCIKDYNSQTGGKTLQIYVDDIIEGKQNSFFARISEDGYFSVKLPLYYPHVVWVRSALFNGSVFMEPGKELFQMIGQGVCGSTSLFMGEPDKINTDLAQLAKINSFNYEEMLSNILDMKPSMYKAYCQDLQEKDNAATDSVMRTGTIGAKAYQVKKLEIEYRYANYIIEYDWNYRTAIHNKNKVSDRQNEEIKMDTLSAGYYNFINKEMANNPLAVLTSGYNVFVNRIKYLDLVRDDKIVYKTSDIMEEWRKTGNSFSKQEEIMIGKLKEIELLENAPEQKEFKDKYEMPREKFLKKYRDSIPDLYKYRHDIENAIIMKTLTGKGISFSDEEKQLLKAFETNDNLESSKSIREFYKTYGDSLRKFNSDHRDFTKSLFNKKRQISRNKNLSAIFGIQKGFATDIMTAQDYCSGILDEMAPVSDNELHTLQQQITDPFVFKYIEFCNENIKHESGKTKTGYNIKEVPKTKPELVFDSLMIKYKGKVVFVDFWATWCGPCRMGIERMKILKEEMEGENVAFVYITNQTSPEKTWLKMIPDIKGDHYRVSFDEWSYMSSKFNISGIPHYVLVGKNGRVINPDFRHIDNETLKAELEKCLKE